MTKSTNGKTNESFRVLVGCDWGDGYREVGTIVTGVPAKIVPTWLAEGVLEPADGAKVAGSAGAPDPPASAEPATSSATTGEHV